MKIKYFITAILASVCGLVINGCSGFLDTEPRNLLTDQQVWNDPAAIKAYLAKLYGEMQLESFEYEFNTQAAFPSTWTDEALRSYTWGDSNNQLMPINLSPWWGYYPVRQVNEFLIKIQEGNVEENQKQEFIAEAKFIRAYYYFSLVKRYGGVPVLKTPQDISTPIEELQLPRSTEKDVYMFIKEDLDEAIAGLPPAYDSNNRYRATKYTALALKSRAMLYAGSIANYSFVDLNGLVGIPASDKEFFYEESKKASEEIINSKRFGLYQKQADKVQNFQELFLDKTWHDELIFVKAYSTDKAHSWDYFNAPQSFKIDYGCATNPTLEMVETFDYIDGSEGTLKTEDESGNFIEFDNPYDLFKDKDPRLLASVLVPFAPWQGDKIEVRRGIIEGNSVTLASNLTAYYKNSAVTISGKDGIIPTNDPTKTGFYLKKYMNPNSKLASDKSTQNYIVFRFAEIYLNYAEAAVELNKDLGKALEYMNLIRDRAGVARLTAIDKELVRKERKTELAFENHRWWDMIRWRISTEVINNYQFTGLFPYLVWDEGKPLSQMKYIFKKEPALKTPRVFDSRLYYNKIADGDITSNPKIVQNPGY